MLKTEESLGFIKVGVGAGNIFSRRNHMCKGLGAGRTWHCPDARRQPMRLEHRESRVGGAGLRSRRGRLDHIGPCWPC